MFFSVILFDFILPLLSSKLASQNFGRLYFLHMEKQDEGSDQEGAVLSEEGD